MRNISTSLLAAGLFFFSHAAWSQTNACDLTRDGKVDSADVQAAINMTLGLSTCTANVAGANTCNVVVVQRIINASMGSGCATSSGLHVVTLNWTASPSQNVSGYKVYRSASSAGPFTLLQSLGSVTSYTDNTVLSGQTYYYAITSVNSSNNESSYSNIAQAVIGVP